jgi:hypothetical protein
MLLAEAYAACQMGVGSMPKWFWLIFTLLCSCCGVSGAQAADRAVPRVVHSARQCGCCGCLHVFYDYHRELRSTYGVGMDPRNYDQTEPYYRSGAVRAYPQYWSDQNGYEFHY